MTRYTMRARSQGVLYTQRATARLAEKDVRRWVFTHSMDPESRVHCAQVAGHEAERLLLRPAADVHPQVRSISLARTHVVLNNTPPLPSMSRNDEAVEVNARGLNARDAVKAPIEATGSNPHLSVYGWPFCLDDLGGVDDMERGMI